MQVFLRTPLSPGFTYDEAVDAVRAMVRTKLDDAMRQLPIIAETDGPRGVMEHAATIRQLADTVAQLDEQMAAFAARSEVPV